MNRDKRNQSGANDPTAYKAISNTDMDLRRFRKALNALYNVCDKYGFYFDERVVLKDKKTGKIWR